MFLGHEVHPGEPSLEVDGWKMIDKTEKETKPEPLDRLRSWRGKAGLFRHRRRQERE